MPRSDRYDEEDRPRSRRRRDDEDDRPAPKKGPSVLLILGIVFGVLFVLCGGGGAAIVFGLVLPAAQKVKEKQAELEAARAEAERKANQFDTPVLNNRVTPANLARVRPGVNLAGVEELLGTGSPASEPHVKAVTDRLPNRDAAERWQAAHRLGRVYHWQNRDDHILVAFTDGPNAGGQVAGVAALMGNKATEPVRLLPVTDPNDKTPVATVTVAELAEQHAYYRDRWVTLKGAYNGADFEDRFGVTLVAPSGRSMTVRPTAGGRFPFDANPQPRETLVFTGKVTGNEFVMLLRDAEFVSRTPAEVTPPAPPKAAPPTPVPTPPKPVELVKVSAEDLAAEFATDSAAATKKYAGKTLALNGTVEQTTPTGSRLTLKGKAAADGKKAVVLEVLMQAEARDGAKKLKAGDAVRLTAKFISFRMAPANAPSSGIILSNGVIEK